MASREAGGDGMGEAPAGYEKSLTSSGEKVKNKGFMNQNKGDTPDDRA